MRKVYFIGFGPGDIELLTLKAYRILKSSDVIIYPGSIIEEELLKEFNSIKINSHGKRLEEIVNIIYDYVTKGLTVSRIVSGDPCFFSSILEQIILLEQKGVEVEIIPGISSFSASASVIKTELTNPRIPGVAILRVKGKTLERDYLEEIAATNLTIVLLLSVHKIEEICKRVMKYRKKDTPVVVVYKATRKDQRILTGTLRDISEKVKRENISKTAVIIIGDVLRKEFIRSKLYSSLD